MKSVTNMIQWADSVLLSKKYTILNSPEPIQTTPYSSVLRFSTNRGFIYLKQTPSALSLEPMIIQILHDKFLAQVPIVLGINEALQCFLMTDAGEPLRETLKNNFQPDLLSKGLQEYSSIQYAAAKHINIFLDLGVPDWRLDTLPILYQDLINQTELLTQDGLTANELDTLHDLCPVLSSLCILLSDYKIPETLNHCDFHDNNVLIDDQTKKITIIDWGETVLTHPFFSLLAYLTTSAYRYKLTQTNPHFIALINAWFKHWHSFETSKTESKTSVLTHSQAPDTNSRLLEGIRLAKKLWPIYSALGYYRLIISSNLNAEKAELQSYFNVGRNAGRLSGYFKAFIKTNIGLSPSDTSRVDLTDPCREIQG